MLLLSSSSSGNGPRRGPLTSPEASPSSCSLTMGALCWVLPLEEDEEMLEEEQQQEEGGEAFPGAGLAERLLEEATCCLSRQQHSEGLVLLVN